MATLQMEFDPTGDHVTAELRIAPPYEFLVHFISCEIGHSSPSVRRWIHRLRDAIEGHAPVVDCDGNTWTVDADAETAKFTNLIDDRVESFPTPIVVEAIAGWLAFMETTGRDRTPKPSPS